MSRSHASPTTPLTLWHPRDGLGAWCVVKRGHCETGLPGRALCLQGDDLLIPSLVARTHSCMCVSESERTGADWRKPSPDAPFCFLIVWRSLSDVARLARELLDRRDRPSSSYVK